MGSGKTDTIGRVRWLFAVLVANLAALCLAADLTPGMREAVTALQRGDFTSAETKLRAELKLRPNDGEALSLLGVALDNQKKFSEADPVHRRAIAATPPTARAFGNYGTHLLLTGNERGARDAFQKALAVDRNDPFANLHLARFALAAKDSKGTLLYLDQLPATQQDDPDAAVLRLAALDLGGERQKADEVFQRLSAATRSNAEWSGSLGWTLAQAGLYERAEAFLTQALTLQPANFHFLYDLGVVALYSQRYERARELLETAVRQQPEQPDALYSLAFVYNALQQPEPALRLLAQAARVAPQRTDVLRLIAVTTGELSADEDSAAAWDRYLKLVPNDDTARRERGFARTHIREFESGIADLEWYIARHPADPIAYYQLGMAQSNSDPTKGIESLNKALALKPGFTAARAARGALHYVQGNPEAAVPDLEAATAGEPSNGLILDRLGQAYRALDRLDDAIRALRRAAELAPGESTVVLHLASALAEAGKDAESEILMGRYRQMRPPQAPKDLMRYLSLTPEQQRADYRVRVEKAVQEHPEDAIAQVHYLKLSLEEGRMDDAATAARAIAGLKTSAAVMADAGRALLEARQYATAKGLLERAAAADPSAGLELDLATAVFHTNGAADGLRQLERVPSARLGAEYRLARAQMLDASGKAGDAIAEMNRAIEASPKAPHLYWQEAILLFRNERGADALELLSKAAQSMPQERQFPVIHAVLLELSGQSEEAIRELDTVQRRWPEFSASGVARGIFDAAHDRCPEASQALSTAVSLGAHSPEVLGHLADCILRSAPARTEEAESAIKWALRLAPGDPWLQSLTAQIPKKGVTPARPAEAAPDPRRLFQARPPGEW
jgi:Flp pilus assembly protein TadD